MSGAARASIVIPAHDEERVIGRTLTAALAGTAPHEYETVVVCNGTTDATPEIAAAFDGVRVVEIPTPSKTAALNAGDAAVSAFPRVYLDADVVLGPGALEAVVAALESGHPAAAPRPVFDLTGLSLPCRAYYAIRSRLGYVNHHVIGAGVYAVSAEGRARFGAFPDVIADDGWVYAHFDHAERVNPPGATFTVHPPRTLRSLYRRQVRIVAGNQQLAALGHRVEAPRPTWRDVVRAEPRLLPAAAVYVAVTVAARVHARLRARRGVHGWNRDETSRGVVGTEAGR